MFTFLSYGVECILWGALLSLIVCALLLLSAYKVSNSGNLSPHALIAAAVLFLILLSQFSGLIMALRTKSAVIEAIDMTTATVNWTNPGYLKELRQSLSDKYPIINSIAGSSLLQNIDPQAPLESLKNLISGYFNDFIFRRVCWAAASTIVFSILIFLPDNRQAGRRRGGRKTTSLSGRHYGEDFLD